MKPTTIKYVLMPVLAIGGWMGHGTDGSLVATAEAVIGRPSTPLSYAGVARRTTVRAVTPGVGAPGVGGQSG